MHLGGLLSTQEARVADSYASFVLSNLPRASITPWLHAARLPFLNYIAIGRYPISHVYFVYYNTIQYNILYLTKVT